MRLHEEPEYALDRDHLVVVRKIGVKRAVEGKGDRRIVECVVGVRFHLGRADQLAGRAIR